MINILQVHTLLLYIVYSCCYTLRQECTADCTCTVQCRKHDFILLLYTAMYCQVEGS